MELDETGTLPGDVCRERSWNVTHVVPHPAYLSSSILSRTLRPILESGNVWNTDKKRKRSQERLSQ